jgi:dihydroxyacetone kinase
MINLPETMVREDNEGLALAYPHLVRLSPGGILLRANPKPAGKVALVIGHGGGHTPSMGGLVGPGLLDGDVYGPLFTCASGVRIAQVMALAQRAAGVALLISNHAGDVLNARLALRRVQQAGIPAEGILLGDDLSTAPRTALHERRGLGGLLFALKTGGALAEAGGDLQQVARLMRKANERTATLAVAVKAPFHPFTGQPLFDLPPGQIEIGAGVHGEPGVYRGQHLPADAIVDLLIERLVSDLRGFDERRLLVFVNGAGGTSRSELHLVYRRAHQQLVSQGFLVAAAVVESLFTTLDMGGFSLSLCAADDELLEYWHAPASAAAFRWPYW